MLFGLTSAAAINTKFAKIGDDYVARVTGQSYTRRDTLVKMFGKHAKKDENGKPAKFSNANVTVFLASNLNNEFERIPWNILHLFENLREFLAETIGLKELDKKSFKNGKNLKKIILGNDRIETINASSFYDCTKLEEIQFNNNIIDWIDDDAFVGQSGLKRLTLKGNNFSFISPRLLEPLSGLIELTIVDNPIASFHPESFFSMTKLQVLNLNNNGLTHFSSKLLREKNQLAMINLNYNKIASIDNDILEIWPNNAGVSLIENACVSKSYDQLGTDEWPMEEAAHDLRPCFIADDDSLNDEDLDSVEPIIEVERNTTTDDSSESIESQMIEIDVPEDPEDNETKTSVADLFAHDGKTHDEDSEDDMDFGGENETVVTTTVNSNKEDIKSTLIKSTTESIKLTSISTTNNFDDKSFVKESATDVSPSDKKNDKDFKEEDPTTFSVNETKTSNETNDEEDSFFFDERNETSLPNNPSNASDSSYLHPYEKTKGRVYVSAKNQYTCVLKNIESTLKHIDLEHKANYTDENVTVVFVRDSRLHNIPPVILKLFPNLKSLSVENSGLKTMDSDLFVQCGKLENLDLSHNRIDRVHGDSLKICTSLKTVDITNNPIDRIENEFFTNNPGLAISFGDLHFVPKL